MPLFNVTDKVDFDWADGESLPITKCVCGAEFKTWDFHISIYQEDATKCPKCSRKLFWKPFVQVWEVIEPTK
jgi:DNA-directed RNA polymerase subunit RPC12/RpoP